MEHLAAAGHVLLADDAEAWAVDLQRHDARLQPAPLEAAQRVPDRAVRNLGLEAALHQPRLVLRVTAPELLTERLGGSRTRRHDDAGDRTLPAGLPRSLAALDVAVPVVRRGVLAEVPDVAAGVGGVPVVGLLGERPVGSPQDVLHDRGPDAHDQLLLVRDTHDLAEVLALVRAPVSEHQPGMQREVRVAHRMAEVRVPDVRLMRSRATALQAGALAATRLRRIGRRHDPYRQDRGEADRCHRLASHDGFSNRLELERPSSTLNPS